jgi:Ankyrin repeats (3 copies)
MGPHRSTELVKILIDSGADVNARTSEGDTPLLLAAELPIVRLLLDAGAAVNAKYPDGSTALHEAASLGLSAAVICCLLKAGADATATDNDGLDAAAVATKRGHTAAAALLQRAADDQRSKQQQQQSAPAAATTTAAAATATTAAAMTAAERLAPLQLSSGRFTSAACDAWRIAESDMPVREQHLRQILQSLLEQCPGTSGSALRALRKSAQVLEADIYNSAASWPEYLELVVSQLDAAADVIADPKTDRSGDTRQAFADIVCASTAALFRLGDAISVSSAAAVPQEGIAVSAAVSDGTAVHDEAVLAAAASAAAPAAATADTTTTTAVAADNNVAECNSTDSHTAGHSTAAVASDGAVDDLTVAAVSTVVADAINTNTEAAADDIADNKAFEVPNSDSTADTVALAAGSRDAEAVACDTADANATITVTVNDNKATIVEPETDSGGTGAADAAATDDATDTVSDSDSTAAIVRAEADNADTEAAELDFASDDANAAVSADRSTTAVTASTASRCDTGAACAQLLMMLLLLCLSMVAQML